MDVNHESPSGLTRPLTQSFLSRLVAPFDNVWLGILWASLLFIYCSIGSAVPQVRQHVWFEMTEFEWFHWWPFNVLIALLIFTLIVVTLRRIPLRTVNAGVWMIHTGIITLTIGSYIYFGFKVEGDTPVFRRSITIERPSMTGPTSLVALPGATLSVPTDEGSWRFQIQSTNTSWPILSDEHKGKTAYAVNVMVTPPDGEPFIRQLLDGYPQYTEDVLPGRGRAIKNIGRKLVDESLSLTLDYEPQTHFHVIDTWALFVRRVGDAEWVQRPIRGLPRYNDHVASREQVFTDPNDRLAPRPLDLILPPGDGGDALSSATVHVTGYLRYAHMDHRWRDGGVRHNPVLSLSLIASGAPHQSFELLALDPRRNVAGDGNVRFVWLNDRAALEKLSGSSLARLTLSISGTEVELKIPITPAMLVGRDGKFSPIGETGFSYRVRNLHDNLSLPGQGSSVSVAVIDVETPDGSFTRWVADNPSMTRDMSMDGADPHGLADDEPRELDRRIQATYTPAGAPIIFAAHPGGLEVIVNSPTGRVMEKSVRAGETVEVVPGLALRIDGFWSHAIAETKPFIVPNAQRRRNAGEGFAMIRLEIDTGRETQHRWVRFNQYAFPDRRYSYGGRFSYMPEKFRLSDGSVVEVLFSREQRPLPAPIALVSFDLDTHIGGYTGSTSAIRNYVSRLLFQTDDGWTSEPSQIAVNHPTEFGGFWYFQSTWDKPSPNDPNGGMNYTGLGVGNRRGVYIQLAGCCLSVVGMIFAFYVKPVLKRRRAQQSQAKALRTTAPAARPSTNDAPEPAEARAT